MFFLLKFLKIPKFQKIHFGNFDFFDKGGVSRVLIQRPGSFGFSDSAARNMNPARKLLSRRKNALGLKNKGNARRRRKFLGILTSEMLEILKKNTFRNVEGA